MVFLPVVNAPGAASGVTGNGRTPFGREAGRAALGCGAGEKSTQPFGGNLPKSCGTRRVCAEIAGVAVELQVFGPGGAVGWSHEWSDAALGITELVEGCG